ncbi:AAA family ATPase [Tessaracoccus oleiagri]|uniref:PIF1-like helicase n=1 Tax=Tessaracoccus oleiagri TaxID=686624 RepID=A0A1G9HJK8_9ACTN|nr:AAA family ATPase [Tessaracoccus oleiagri]SDL13109.1 PIF1-like helicase [Tessaracoccus oleiagri]
MTTQPSLELTDEFRAALAMLDAGRHLFLTGKAGTGKSTLIRHFMANTDRNVVVVAPTGIAALNVEGYTIHRLFSFVPGMTADDVRGDRYYPSRFAAALKALDTLIIDEASMVRADLFDALAAALERFGPHPGQPFGGVQIVLVGDLYQLPPVVTDGEGAHFTTRYGTPYFFSADAFAAHRFEVAQLTHVFRQAGDPRLTEILNAIREGTIDEDARAVLNSRTDPGFVAHDGEFWLTLTTTNRIATARNRAALDRLPGDPHVSHAVLTGELDQADPPTDLRLEYKVGAQVMLLVNDPLDRYVNGTLGTIAEIGTDDDGAPLVTITTSDGRRVRVGPYLWEVTRPVADWGRIRQEVVGTFKQLPFRLAWAITIHKSQGQTVDRLVVDLSGGTFAYGQLYVALSRCTSMAGLVLQRDVIPKDLKTDQRIRRFLASGTPAEEARPVYLGICSAGKEGPRTRPRPVELALVTEEGLEVTTLVNPESDLYESRSDYGICAPDVVAAPRLAEAWPALLEHLEGRVPVGVGIDRELEFIDFELKRCGVVAPMPLGIDLLPERLTVDERRALRAPTALERARAARAIARRLRPADPFASTFTGRDRSGYLLPRGAEPEAAVFPSTMTPDERAAWAEVVRSRALAATDELDPATVLLQGTRICFTGSVLDASGRALGRDEMERLARDRGLVPVANVSRTRCDVLVCAEVGTQSTKARKAAELGKPILAADRFLAWARN